MTLSRKTIIGLPLSVTFLFLAAYVVVASNRMRQVLATYHCIRLGLTHDEAEKVLGMQDGIPTTPINSAQEVLAEEINPVTVSGRYLKFYHDMPYIVVLFYGADDRVAGKRLLVVKRLDPLSRALDGMIRLIL